MNLQDMLNEAFAKIDAMTKEDFERVYAQFGYSHEPKISFEVFGTPVLVDTLKDLGNISYVMSVAVHHSSDEKFASSNEYKFGIAA
jgi:hypothetical protein